MPFGDKGNGRNDRNHNDRNFKQGQSRPYSECPHMAKNVGLKAEVCQVTTDYVLFQAHGYHTLEIQEPHVHTLKMRMNDMSLRAAFPIKADLKPGARVLIDGHRSRTFAETGSVRLDPEFAIPRTKETKDEEKVKNEEQDANEPSAENSAKALETIKEDSEPQEGEVKNAIGSEVTNETLKETSEPQEGEVKNAIGSEATENPRHQEIESARDQGQAEKKFKKEKKVKKEKKIAEPDKEPQPSPNTALTQITAILQEHEKCKSVKKELEDKIAAIEHEYSLTIAGYEKRLQEREKEFIDLEMYRQQIENQNLTLSQQLNVARNEINEMKVAAAFQIKTVIGIEEPQTELEVDPEKEAKIEDDLSLTLELAHVKENIEREIIESDDTTDVTKLVEQAMTESQKMQDEKNKLGEVVSTMKDVNENEDGVTMTIDGMKKYTRHVIEFTLQPFKRIMSEDFGDHVEDSAYAVLTDFLDKKQ